MKPGEKELVVWCRRCKTFAGVARSEAEAQDIQTRHSILFHGELRPTQQAASC